MSLVTSSFYNLSGLQSTVRFSQQGSLPSNASNNSAVYAALPSELREEVPVQRCRFSLPKCFTKAMKAISNFFRSIFNRFRSDLEPTLSEAEVVPLRLDPVVEMGLNDRLEIIRTSACLQREQALIDGLVAQGVPPSMAAEVKTKYILNTTFTAWNGQQFKIEKDHGYYFIKRTA